MTSIFGGFTIKPTAIKKVKKATSNSHRTLNKILYAVAHKVEDKWEAHINTKGLEGYENITILPFTEKSLNLTGRTDVFYHNKDKTNHWIRVMRHQFDANVNPGSTDLYCSLCEDSCFSGYIVKIDGILQFDMIAYKGSKGLCNNLLTRNNNKDEEINECNYYSSE
jgi:hypothetical protein